MPICSVIRLFPFSRQEMEYAPTAVISTSIADRTVVEVTRMLPSGGLPLYDHTSVDVCHIASTLYKMIIWSVLVWRGFSLLCVILVCRIILPLCRCYSPLVGVNRSSLVVATISPRLRMVAFLC